jgi:hypothetical protein
MLYNADYFLMENDDALMINICCYIDMENRDPGISKYRDPGRFSDLEIPVLTSPQYRYFGIGIYSYCTQPFRPPLATISAI